MDIRACLFFTLPPRWAFDRRFVLLPDGGEVLIASHSAVGSAVVVEAPQDQRAVFARGDNDVRATPAIPCVRRTQPVVVALRSLREALRAERAPGVEGAAARGGQQRRRSKSLSRSSSAHLLGYVGIAPDTLTVGFHLSLLVVEEAHGVYLAGRHLIFDIPVRNLGSPRVRWGYDLTTQRLRPVQAGQRAGAGDEQRKHRGHARRASRGADACSWHPASHHAVSGVPLCVE